MMKDCSGMEDRIDPPFEDLLFKLSESPTAMELRSNNSSSRVVEEQELPLVDMGPVVRGEEDKMEWCKNQIVKAAKEWGFFQVVNHGISHHVLQEMSREQVKLFRQPFHNKTMDKCMNLSLSPGSYRWGTPTATSLTQLSWSEAFHFPFTDIIRSSSSSSSAHCHHTHPVPNTFSSTVKKFAATVSELAQNLASILADKLGNDEDTTTFFKNNCLPSTCYLRMNRYPPCPNYSHVFGMMPHTDSDFLTILYQDQVGGLELIKDGEWIAVKPNPKALIVNIGDLFQAWSNGMYKSVEHRVVANPKVERFSIAYFLCPSNDAIIESWNIEEEPSLYRKFSFKEYRQQVQDDVRTLGYKIGLSRFRVCG